MCKRIPFSFTWNLLLSPALWSVLSCGEHCDVLTLHTLRTQQYCGHYRKSSRFYTPRFLCALIEGRRSGSRKDLSKYQHHGELANWIWIDFGARKRLIPIPLHWNKDNMVFLCPTCNVTTSGSKKTAILSKKAPAGRISPKPTDSEPVYKCPCCKELRSIKQYNPIKRTLKYMYSKIDKHQPKKTPSPKKASARPDIGGREVTTQSLDYLCSAVGISRDCISSSDYRHFSGSESVTVSWDDTIQMRRHVLHIILQNAVEKAVIVLQCAARKWDAISRVKLMRKLKRGTVPESSWKSFRGPATDSLKWHYYHYIDYTVDIIYAAHYIISL